jgi:hypothetical protein
MPHSAHHAPRRALLTADELANPPQTLTPSQVLRARLALAQDMCQLVLADPLPPQPLGDRPRAGGAAPARGPLTRNPAAAWSAGR